MLIDRARREIVFIGGGILTTLQLLGASMTATAIATVWITVIQRMFSQSRVTGIEQADQAAEHARSQALADVASLRPLRATK